MKKVIFNAQILPTSNPNEFIPKGYIEIDKNIITRVSEGVWEGSQPTQDIELFDAQGKLVIPGLFNGHTHLAMTLFKGFGENIELIDWLYKYIFPLEAKWTNPETVAIGTRLALIESIRSGVTSVADMYYFGVDIADAFAQSGLRGWVGQAVVGFKVPDAKNLQEGFKNMEVLMSKYGKHPRITPVISPHTAFSDDMNTLKQTAAFAKEHHLFVNTHVAESEGELKLVAEKHSSKKHSGMTPVQVFYEAGFADSPMAWAHGVCFSEDDFKLMKDFKQIGIIHNPECNMKLSSGVAPLWRFHKENIPFGIGTDGSASNNNLDLLSEIDVAVKLQRFHRKMPTAFPTHSAFEAITLGGAQVFGADKHIGTIEKGKKADLAFIDMEQSHLQPCHDVMSTIIFCARAGDVSDLMVDGAWIMRNREIETLNEYEIIQEAKTLGQKIKKDILG